MTFYASYAATTKSLLAPEGVNKHETQSKLHHNIWKLIYVCHLRPLCNQSATCEALCGIKCDKMQQEVDIVTDPLDVSALMAPFVTWRRLTCT